MPAREHAEMPGAVIVCTDGSGNAKTRYGAWAYYAKLPDGTTRSSSDATHPTTNNLMEMEAVIQAIRAFPHGPLHIVSDSQYVIHGICEWIYGWHKRNWVKGDDKPVSNREKWEEMWSLVKDRDVTFEHVKGHKGHEGNEIADKACTVAVKAYKVAVEGPNAFRSFKLRRVRR